MTTVQELLASKGAEVYSIGPQASNLDAALLMNEHKIGCLVVMESERVVGIITERDLLRRVLAEQRNPANTKVHETMTHEVVCCQAEQTLEDIQFIIKDRKIRHIPVADEEGRLLGLISIGDLNSHQVNDQRTTIHFLHEYIQGRA